MSQEKYYTIKVGFADPREVERGEINRSTGLPAAATEKAISVVGRFAIPNHSRIWAKRIMATDGKPSGDIEPLPWGTAGGESVDIRYLKNSRSLDKAFQEKAGLKLGFDEGHIYLTYGLNDYDVKSNPMLVQMLKLHTMNGNSICRDPENRKVVYEEYDAEKIVKKSLRNHELKLDGMNLIMSVKDNAKKLKVLARVFEIDDKKQDKIVISDLMDKVNENPGLFNDQMNWYKNHMQAIIVKANDFQLLELNISGEVHITGDRTGPVLARLSAKLPANKKMEYMVDNCFEPEVFDAIERIKEALVKKEREMN